MASASAAGSVVFISTGQAGCTLLINGNGLGGLDRVALSLAEMQNSI